MSPEEQLRQAFEAGADQVEFGPDALSGIRSRVHRRTTRRRAGLVGFASAGAALAATAAAVVVAAPGRTPAPPHLPVGTTQSSATASPAPSPTGTDGPNPAAGTDTLPVYYVGQVGGRPLLYREFRAATAPGSLTETLRQGVTTMLTAAPLDPDYTNPWPAGATVRGVGVDQGVATVDLAGAADRADPMTAAAAQAAVQQLVWTLTAIAADRRAPLTGVVLHFDGAARSTLWGAADVSGVLVRASAADTEAPVWLFSPQQGDTVPGTFTAQIDAAVFEAAARLRVRDADGQVVSDQAVHLSAGAPARGQAKVTLTLPPGRYTVEAYYVSIQDGTEKALDGHQITVG